MVVIAKIVVIIGVVVEIAIVIKEFKDSTLEVTKEQGPTASDSLQVATSSLPQGLPNRDPECWKPQCPD